MKRAHSRFFLRRRPRLDRWLGLAALGAGTVMQLACSANEGHGGQGTVPDANVCLEVTSHPDYPDQVYYQRKTWDPVARILTKEGSASSAFTKVDTLQWRYADAGRIITYIGVEQPFQHDYLYDEHDNVREFRLSYPAKPNLFAASTADTWIGYRNENEYDPAGRLAASTVSAFGQSPSSPPYRLSFGEDEAGRCQRIEYPSTIELRSYDESGRLKHTELTKDGVLQNHVDLTYDDRGRLHTRSYTADVSQPYSGMGTATTTFDYGSDGSQTITYHNPLTDIANDENIVVTRTPACQPIDDDIGAPADLRCRLPQSND